MPDKLFPTRQVLLVGTFRACRLFVVASRPQNRLKITQQYQKKDNPLLSICQALSNLTNVMTTQKRACRTSTANQAARKLPLVDFTDLQQKLETLFWFEQQYVEYLEIIKSITQQVASQDVTTVERLGGLMFDFTNFDNTVDRISQLMQQSLQQLAHSHSFQIQKQAQDLFNDDQNQFISNNQQKIKGKRAPVVGPDGKKLNYAQRLMAQRNGGGAPDTLSHSSSQAAPVGSALQEQIFMLNNELNSLRQQISSFQSYNNQGLNQLNNSYPQQGSMSSSPQPQEQQLQGFGQMSSMDQIRKIQEQIRLEDSRSSINLQQGSKFLSPQIPQAQDKVNGISNQQSLQNQDQKQSIDNQQSPQNRFNLQKPQVKEQIIDGIRYRVPEPEGYYFSQLDSAFKDVDTNDVINEANNSISRPQNFQQDLDRLAPELRELQQYRSLGKFPQNQYQAHEVQTGQYLSDKESNNFQTRNQMPPELRQLHTSNSHHIQAGLSMSTQQDINQINNFKIGNQVDPLTRQATQQSAYERNNNNGGQFSNNLSLNGQQSQLGRFNSEHDRLSQSQQQYQQGLQQAAEYQQQTSQPIPQSKQQQFVQTSEAQQLQDLLNTQQSARQQGIEDSIMNDYKSYLQNAPDQTSDQTQQVLSKYYNQDNYITNEFQPVNHGMSHNTQSGVNNIQLNKQQQSTPYYDTDDSDTNEFQPQHHDQEVRSKQLRDDLLAPIGDVLRAHQWQDNEGNIYDSRQIFQESERKHKQLGANQSQIQEDTENEFLPQYYDNIPKSQITNLSGDRHKGTLGQDNEGNEYDVEQITNESEDTHQQLKGNNGQDNIEDLENEFLPQHHENSSNQKQLKDDYMQDWLLDQLGSVNTSKISSKDISNINSKTSNSSRKQSDITNSDMLSLLANQTQQDEQYQSDYYQQIEDLLTLDSQEQTFPSEQNKVQQKQNAISQNQQKSTFQLDSLSADQQLQDSAGDYEQQIKDLASGLRYDEYNQSYQEKTKSNTDTGSLQQGSEALKQDQKSQTSENDAVRQAQQQYLQDLGLAFGGLGEDDVVESSRAVLRNRRPKKVATQDHSSDKAQAKLVSNQQQKTPDQSKSTNQNNGGSTTQINNQENNEMQNGDRFENHKQVSGKNDLDQNQILQNSNDDYMSQIMQLNTEAVGKPPEQQAENETSGQGSSATQDNSQNQTSWQKEYEKNSQLLQQSTNNYMDQVLSINQDIASGNLDAEQIDKDILQKETEEDQTPPKGQSHSQGLIHNQAQSDLSLNGKQHMSDNGKTSAESLFDWQSNGNDNNLESQNDNQGNKQIDNEYLEFRFGDEDKQREKLKDLQNINKNIDAIKSQSVEELINNQANQDKQSRRDVSIDEFLAETQKRKDQYTEGKQAQHTNPLDLQGQQELQDRVRLIQLAQNSSNLTNQQEDHKQIEAQNYSKQQEDLDSESSNLDKAINSYPFSQQALEQQVFDDMGQIQQEPPLLQESSEDLYWIHQLQTRLTDAGLDCGDDEVENIDFGGQTKEALLTYQALNDLPEYGFVNNHTWIKLLGESYQDCLKESALKDRISKINEQIDVPLNTQEQERQQQEGNRGSKTQFTLSEDNELQFTNAAMNQQDIDRAQSLVEQFKNEREQQLSQSQNTNYRKEIYESQDEATSQNGATKGQSDGGQEIENEILLQKKAPLLRNGDGGKDVYTLQMLLIKKGYGFDEEEQEWWQFGDSTNEAVSTFQACEGLAVTGLTTEDTWSKLLENVDVQKLDKEIKQDDDYNVDRSMESDENRIWLLGENRWEHKR